MSSRSIEHTFEPAIERRQKTGGTPTTPRTLPDQAEVARQRRADARRLGRHPAPASEGRSRNMQAIRRTDTKPEIALRSALHRLGYRFRKDLRLDLGSVRVRPDIVFTRARVAVFVDGCFWHLCPEHGRMPRVNEHYWRPKLERNQQRDTVANEALREAGWSVVRLWEHTTLGDATDLVVAAIAQEAGFKDHG